MAFKPGEKWNGNRKGRPKGVGLGSLLDAIERWQKKTGKNYYDVMVERSITNPTLLAAVLRKLVPDLQEVEHSGNVNIQIVAPEKGILNGNTNKPGATV